MSWPLKYDPASQSISFGGRDKTLYPNSLAPFDQVALVAADFSRTYCDCDRERRPRPGNGHSEVGDEKVEDTSAEGTNREGRCATDTSLNDTTFISYTKLNQVEDSRQKQKRFVQSLARGKWNRYRRQCTSSTSYEAHNPTDVLSNGCESASPHSPTNVSYLTLFEARLATLNHQAARELDREDSFIEGAKWSSDSLLVNSATIIPTTETNLVIFDIDMVMSEARLNTLPGGNPTRDPNFIHNAQALFNRLLHPYDTIIKPALQLATKIFCFQHKNKKIQQQSEEQALDVDLERNVPLSKRDVKEWKARRGYYRPLFCRTRVQSVAKAIEKGSEGEEERHEKNVGWWR